MKNILGLSAAIVVAISASASAAVTLTSRNFSSTTAGVPIVSAAGASLDQGTFIWSAGRFATLPNFNTSTALEIIAAFTAVPAAPGGVSATLDGLFNASQSPDFGTSDAPSVFVGKQAFILVGNGATLALSTAIAVFDAGVTFAAPNALGAGSQTLTANTIGQVVFGTVRTVTTQPSGTFNTPQGVALSTGIAIPEPSAALLGAIGALGLLRRRRN
ncbi:MAG: hypothetical protein V4689_06455 [Verrucomicrobiota bacterium]